MRCTCPGLGAGQRAGEGYPFVPSFRKRFCRPPAILILALGFTLSRKPSSPCDSIRGRSGGGSMVVPVLRRDPTSKMRMAGRPPAVLILASDFTLSRKPYSPCDSIRGRSAVVPVRQQDPTSKMRMAGRPPRARPYSAMGEPGLFGRSSGSVFPRPRVGSGLMKRPSIARPADPPPPPALGHDRKMVLARRLPRCPPCLPLPGPRERRGAAGRRISRPLRPIPGRSDERSATRHSRGRAR